MRRSTGDAGVGGLASAIVFSSIAGRFGNAGQTDYAAADDLLCKSISNMRRRAELGTAGRMGLPTRVDRVVRFAGADAPGRLWAVVTPRDGDEGVDAEVVDEDGRVRVRLEGYRTIELPGGVDAEALAPIRTAMGRG